MLSEAPRVSGWDTTNRKLIFVGCEAHFAAVTIRRCDLPNSCVRDLNGEYRETFGHNHFIKSHVGLQRMFVIIQVFPYVQMLKRNASKKSYFRHNDSFVIFSSTIAQFIDFDS